MTGLQGVVVGAVSFGDNAKIVKFLTAGGTISFVARRARGGKGSVAAIIELGNDLAVEAKASKGGLPVFVRADLIKAPMKARASLEGLGLLTYACELLSKLSPEGSDCSKQLKLLRVMLDVLEGPGPFGHATRIALEAKALTFAGLMPSTSLCVACQTPVTGQARFSHDLGGVLHPECGTGTAVALSVLATVEQLRRTPLKETVGPLSTTTRNTWLLSDFAQHQLGATLKSRGMFQLLAE